MHSFTGAPTEYFMLNKPGVLERILEAEGKNYMMTVISGDLGGKKVKGHIEDVAKMGLVSGHAYTVLAGYKV